MEHSCATCKHKDKNRPICKECLTDPDLPFWKLMLEPKKLGPVHLVSERSIFYPEESHDE